MAKFSENKIPDINADWGLDTSNGLPYTGEAVQEFIKDTFKKKYGYFHYDESLNRYLVFSDSDSCDLYLSDKETYSDLLLNVFDAPFNYSATITLISNSYNAILMGETGNTIQFKFSIDNKSGDSTGENADCTITFNNAGVKKTINKIYTSQQGREGVLLEVDDYLSEGVNNITISIKGQDSLAATTSSIVYQLVNLKFTDNFNISRVYNTDELVEVSCVVEGAGNKIIDWYLDGVQLPFEITDEIPYITAYTVNKNISIAGLAPGVHSLQYKLRSQIGDSWFSSQTLFRNFFVSGVNKTIIGIATELPVGVEPVKSNILDKLYGIIQYVPYNIRYAIYNPTNAVNNTVGIYIDNELQITTNIVNDVENRASIISDTFGNLPIKITVNDAAYELNSEVAVSTIGVSEIPDAKLNLRAFGRDNKALDYDSWVYGDYSTTFDGFYWNVQSGWVDNTLIINAGATVNINYTPFVNDPMATGKTIEIEFATRNVIDNDGVILDLTNDSGHGLLITASEAKLTTSDNKVISTKFKAEETNRISFVINRRDSGNNAGFVFIYINGILSGAAEYSNTATIRVTKDILFNGSSDVLLKQIVIYDKPLSSDEILNNYILYRDSISEMLSIYNRNNVTTSDGQLSPEKLVNTLPVMYFTGLDENRGIPYLETQTGKAATKIDTYFDIEYQNSQDRTRNFKMTNARVRIQGTSSSYYPRKNYRFYSNTEDLDTVVYDWRGNVIEDRLYSFKDGAQPVDCWCLKTDYAESSGSHNTGVARLWNDVLKNALIDNEHKLMTTAQKVAAENGYPYDVRTTVDGFPIVVFYRNTSNHPWQFLGKFNFNNDKSTPSVFGFCDIPGFDNSRMQCWEVLNNGHALCNFTKFDSDYFDENWEDAFEARYDEDNPLIEDLKAFSAWIYSTKDDIEKFKTEKWDHLDVYKMAAYYIYIMRFGAVDQTVKNSMFTSEDGEHFFFINYDNDTIFGVRNDGLLKHGPYIDRQSEDPEKVGTDNPYVYAGHDSVLWNNLEADDEFMEIVKVVDSSLYEAGLTYNAIINMFENEQTLKWCERVCNTDAHYKYIAPPTGRVIESLQGNRNSHRRWWVSERFNLYDAKFVTGDFKNYVAELKIVGEEIPFATITAAKRQPYGYEILNSVSEVTDILDIDERRSFTSPANQTLQEGDPISIYSACNIKELDLSGCMHCAMKVDLSRITSPSVGNSLKKLIMNGDNYALNATTFTGTETLNRLEYLDIQGMHNLGKIDVSNSLNLKTLLAKNSGLTSVTLAPGCLIERLELPSSIEALVLTDLPLLTADNLVLEGDWCNVRLIDISGCPNITNDFNLIWNWYNKTSKIEARSLELHDVNWTDVNIDKLIELGQNLNILLKGKIKLSMVDDKNKLLTLKELFGENIFNKDADLYIYGPNAIYVFGSESILEGETVTFETILFADAEGTMLFSFSSGEREGVVLDRYTGVLTSVENGLDSVEFIVRATYVIGNGRLINDAVVTVNKRTYPQSISLIGPNRITEESTVFSWMSDTEGINGEYITEWSLTGDILDFAHLTTQNVNNCTVYRTAVPENLATGVLSVTLYKKVDATEVARTSLNVNIVNPDVIMTSETNPEVLSVLYNTGKLASDQYMLKSEAELFTEEDFVLTNVTSIFTANKNIKTFDEFKYFTNVTTVPSYCFSNCTKLESITLPESVTKVMGGAFSSTGLKKLFFSNNVEFLHLDAVAYSDNLVELEVDTLNPVYISYNGCIYKDAGATLYMIAPGLTEYVMPENFPTSIYGDGNDVLMHGRMLRKIVFNNVVKNATGYWFSYGYNYLTEISGPEDHPDYSFYNGCLYNKDFSTLIYWPSALAYSNDLLAENVTGFGAYSLVHHKSIKTFTAPENLTMLGQCALQYTGVTDVDFNNVTSAGDYVLGWTKSLKNAIIRKPEFVGKYAFYNSSVTNVTLPEGLTTIYTSMFNGCSSLPSLDLPDSITRFDNFCFQGCSSLTELTIPENVVSMGDSCLAGCYKLGEINSLPVKAPILGSSVFGNTDMGYVGKDSTVKNLFIPSNATGYETSDWDNVLVDIAGFIYNTTL